MNSSPSQVVIRSQTFSRELEDELKFLNAKVLHSTPALLWIQPDLFEPAWADCVWRNVQRLEVESITDAQKKLKAISKKWRYYGDQLNRRGELIVQKLATDRKLKTYRFASDESLGDSPVFTLASSHLILYSFDVTRPTVDGVIPFEENKAIPPSRAYLKLWEALTILGDRPQKGDRVLDLGSSPGSWTWALSELGAQVLSIDRADLDEKVMKNSNIEHRRGDAFAFKPTAMDWVFSDVICYPDKLYEYVQSWLKSGLCSKFICNVKFAGDVDPQVVQKFREIPQGRVLHLLNGKKEVTWIRHPSLK